MYERYLLNKTLETGNATEVHGAVKAIIHDMMTGINDNRLHDYLYIRRDKQPGEITNQTKHSKKHCFQLLTLGACINKDLIGHRIPARLVNYTFKS